MKKFNRYLVIFFILVLAGSFLVSRSGYFIRRIHSARVSQKALYYCPMHPTYTSDRPGDCPICNMKLVKKEEKTIANEPRQAMTRKDICYMHNCPHARDGKPCPMLVVGKEGEQVTCPICGTHIAEGRAPSETQEILYWTDPMLPGYKSDQPGKSPMGMDLVPVYEENGTGSISTSASPSGYAPILVTPQKQQTIGVKTAPAQKIQMDKTIRTVGRIAYDPELYQAEEEYIQAIQALRKAEAGTIPEVKEQAEKLVDSAKIRLKLLGLGNDLIEAIEKSGKPDRSLLYSETGGTVWLYAPIYEYEMPLVKVGDKVDIEVPAIPGKKFAGAIRSINSVLDPMTRTVRIRAVLDNAEGLLKPEMYVNATLQINLGEVLAVPEQAIFSTGEKNIVFVTKPDGIFEPRDVVIGAKSSGYSEVKSGIAEGELVVTSGNFLIDSESRLKAALEGMSGSGGHQHGG